MAKKVATDVLLNLAEEGIKELRKRTDNPIDEADETRITKAKQAYKDGKTQR